MAIDKWLLEVLACPDCKGDLRLTEDGGGLICERCRVMYPVKDDIPNMIPENAIPLDQTKE